ncbi:MAG: serine protease [Dehalococcoidia bacterium]
MRVPRQLARLVLVAALSVGAVFLIACERTAELIPGEATPTPLATETADASASPTPIVVNPNNPAGGGEATGGQVIPDHDLALSIVQVLVIDGASGFEQIVRHGTGVVVNAEAGLIATAYPVVDPYDPDGTRSYTSIVIAADREPGTPPQREFTATLVAADPSVDVAILRVTGDAGGAPLAEGAFDLPAVALGDPSIVGVGFSLRVFGYPGGAEEEQIVETATAAVTGQRGAAGRTGRTWFEMDTRMPFGAAGGPVFDRFGALVGILAQDRYLPTGAVGMARPLDLLNPLLAGAVDAQGYDAPLYRDRTLPGSLQLAPSTGIFVSRPAFAENATETPNGSDLFDYETRFVAGLGALYYEYVVNGAPEGAVIDERWFLDDVEQQTLSSSFVWNGASFGIISDRITAPSQAGMPNGRWRLDVLVDGTLHATATAVIGVDVGTPDAFFQFAASAATAEGNIQAGAFTGAEQLLMAFDVTGMTGATQVEWHVFRDNNRVYTSPSIPWVQGPSGRFWIGYRSPEGTIGPGVWEFELHVDGAIVEVGTITLF